jgi:hypothetical protein
MATDPAASVAPVLDVIRSMDNMIPKYESTTAEDALYNLDAQRLHRPFNRLRFGVRILTIIASKGH